MAMEALVVNIQGLSTNAEDLSDLHIILKQAHVSLQAESIRLLPLLDQIDPSVHSLPYLYILEACASAALLKEQASAVVLPTAKFINLCDKEQIQLAPEKFISACRKFSDHVMHLEAPLRGVTPMMAAICKIQSSFRTFNFLASRVSCSLFVVKLP
ncbi:hypothetical protein ABKV19_000501 [Rosa sericea]